MAYVRVCGSPGRLTARGHPVRNSVASLITAQALTPLTSGGLVYHVLNGANARMPIFHRPGDYGPENAP